MAVYKRHGRLWKVKDGRSLSEAKAIIDAKVARTPGLLDTPAEPYVPKTRNISKALKAGATNQAITGLAASAALGHKPKDVDPEGVLANLAYYGAGLAADVPLFAAAAALAPATGGTSLASIVGREGVKAAIKGAAKETTKQAIKAAAKRGAAYGAGYQALQTPIESVAKGTPYDPKEHLLRTAIGGVAGGVLGPATEFTAGMVKAPIAKAASKQATKLALQRQRLKTAESIAAQAVRAAEAPPSPPLSTKLLPSKSLQRTSDLVKHFTGSGLSKKGLIKSDRFTQIQRPSVLEPNYTPKTEVGKKLYDEAVRKTMQEQYGLGAEELSGLAKPSFWDQFKSGAMRWGKVDSKAGTTMSDLAQKSYLAANEGAYVAERILSTTANHAKILQKAGVSGEDFWAMLGGKKPIPTELQPLVQEARALEKFVLRKSRALGLDVGQLPEYLGHARRTKVGIMGYGPERSHLQARASVDKSDPTFAFHQAKEAPLPEEAYVNNYFDFMKRWAGEVSSAHKLQVMPEAKQNFLRLKALGLHAQAEDVANWFNSTMGLRGRSSKFAIEQFTKDGGISKEVIDQVAAAMAPDVSKRFIQGVQQSMFASWVGSNPISLTKQVLQPLLVGSAEIGPSYVMLGERLNLKPTTHIKNLLNTRAKFLVGPRGVDVTEIPDSVIPASRLGKAVNKATHYIMKPFTKLDVRNRNIMFIGGYERAKKEGLTDSVLEGLLPSQRLWVQEGMKVGGMEEAAIRHGIVRSLRTNYMYSLADRPSVLQNTLGDLMPFSTWSRNQWMILLGDIEQGNIKTLAKRIGYPLAMLELISALTGYDIPGAHPLTSAAGIGSLSVLPALGRPLALAGRGDYSKAAKEAGTAFIPYQLYRRGAKLVEKGPIEGLGYKPTKGPTIQDLFKATKKKLKGSNP